MAKALLIKAKPRDDKKPNALRASGFVPATVYGHDLNQNQFKLMQKSFLRFHIRHIHT